MKFDVESVRSHYPALQERVRGRPLVYLGSAATAQMPRCMMEAAEAVELRRGNVHRGIHALSEACTAAYENARTTVASFLHAAPEQIQFTSGPSDAVNRTADVWRSRLKPGDGLWSPGWSTTPISSPGSSSAGRLVLSFVFCR